jgi:hypothetical protein
VKLANFSRRRLNSRAIANDQSAMSRVAGGFLGAALAGVGVASAAPELTDDVDDVDPVRSDLLGGEPSTAVLRGAASAGRDRGKAGVFRSTCGIGIGGTNLSSLCATGIADGVKRPDAGDGTGGAARAWPDIAASASRQRQNLMVGNAVTPTISLPPEAPWQRACERLSQSIRRYDGAVTWNFGGYLI